MDSIGILEIKWKLLLRVQGSGADVLGAGFGIMLGVEASGRAFREAPRHLQNTPSGLFASYFVEVQGMGQYC